MENEVKKEVETPKPDGKKSKLPFMIIGIVAVLALLGGGGFFAMKFLSSASQAAPATEPEETVTTPDGEMGPTGIYYDKFADFITVLAPSEEYKFTYLKFVPQLELSSEEALAEVTAKLPVLTSKINSVMTDLNWNNLKTEKGREHQAEKLQKELNELLEGGEVIKVYFTTLVVQ